MLLTAFLNRTNQPTAYSDASHSSAVEGSGSDGPDDRMIEYLVTGSHLGLISGK